jgi:hypothetical protein
MMSQHSHVRAKENHENLGIVGLPPELRKGDVPYTRAICKVRELTLLLGVRTLRRCGDGLFFEVPPLASDALITLHPLLEKVLQTVCHKLQEDSGTGGFDLVAPFSRLEKPRNRKAKKFVATVLLNSQSFRE